MNTMKCLFLQFFLILGLACTALAAEPVATVVSVTPETHLIRLGEASPLTQDLILQRVDGIKTGVQGKAQLRLADNTTIAIDPETHISLERFDIKGNQPDVHIRMARGAARVVSGEITKLRADGLAVFTPMATIGIRGTDCSIVATPGKTTIVVNSIGERDIKVTNMLTLEESYLDKPGAAIDVSPAGNVLRQADTKERQEAVRIPIKR